MQRSKGTGDFSPITHHICSLIFFPLSSTVLILKSTPVGVGRSENTHVDTYKYQRSLYRWTQTLMQRREVSIKLSFYFILIFDYRNPIYVTNCVTGMTGDKMELYHSSCLCVTILGLAWLLYWSRDCSPNSTLCRVSCIVASITMAQQFVSMLSR